MKSSEARPLLLLLLRHEETENPRGVLYGQQEVPLSPRGRARTQALVRKLARLPVKAVYGSDLTRAAYGAELLSRETGAPLTLTPLLREIHFGRWTGLTFAELLEIPEFRERLANPAEIRPPGGESLRELSVRALKALNLIREKHPEGLVVVFAHGGFNRALLCTLFEIPLKRFFSLEQRPGAMNLMVFFPEAPPLLALLNAPPELDLAPFLDYYGSGAGPYHKP